MNDSTSTISPEWPTSWPRDSFRSVGSIALVVFFALAVVAVFFGGMATPLPKTALPPHVVEAGLVLQVLLEGIVVAIVLVALPRMSGFSLAQLGFRRLDARALGIALLGAVATAIVCDGGAAIVAKLTHASHEQESIAIFKALHDRGAIVTFAAFAVVVGPIAEEIVFRGLFFNVGLRYGGLWLGVPLSSVLFGLAHGSPFDAIPLALGGIVLCTVYYRARNIGASILAHALFNGMTVAALLVAHTAVS